MGTGGEPVRVLHVDDEPEIPKLTAAFFEHQDVEFACETATSAREGLEKLEESTFDCVVSDYDMPNCNGMQFLEAVRETDPDLPFILFTGKGSEEVASDAISAGVTDYLQKSSNATQYEVLANRIQNAVEQRRSRQAARETEQRLRTIAEKTNDVLWKFTADWEELLFVNSMYEEIWGRSIDELESNPRAFLDGVHPEDTQLVEDGMERLSAGESVDIEFRVNEPEDYERWVWVQAEPIYDENQEDVQKVAGFARDVTDRKREEERFEALVENSTDVVTVVDEERTVTYASPSIEQVLGFSPDEIRGVDALEYVHPDDRADVSAFFSKMLASPDSAMESIEYRFQDNEDSWTWLESRVNTHRTELLDGFVVNSWEITERKRREQERSAMVEFLQRLYEVATNPNLEYDEKMNRLLRVGPEKLGLPYAHLTRIEVDETDPSRGTQTIIEASGNHELLQPGASCPLGRSYCRETVKQDDVVTIENALDAGMGSDPAYETFDLGCYIGHEVTVDGELYGTVFFASAEPREEPFTEAERTFVRFMSKWIGYELERKQARETLETQKRRLEEFAKVVSHDLKNPLNIATQHVELAQAECETDHLEGAKDAIERCSMLISDLLDLARTGTNLGAVERVALRNVVQDSWDHVDTASATLKVETDAVVRAHPNQLQQALENLLQNAVEHGGEDVSVAVGDLDDGFYVADDGPGIPEADRGTVFDAGYTTGQDGTGFGLKIVEEIVDAHGWTITVTSSADGGARFEIADVEPTTGRDGEPTTGGNGEPTTGRDGEPTTGRDGEPTTGGNGEPTTGGNGELRD